MRKVIVDEWMTLDGVAQAPGEKNEDTTDGFRYGGWHMDFVDETFMNWMLTNLNEAGGFLLGRRTYEGFAGHWPNASQEEQHPSVQAFRQTPRRCVRFGVRFRRPIWDDANRRCKSKSPNVVCLCFCQSVDAD